MYRIQQKKKNDVQNVCDDRSRPDIFFIVSPFWYDEGEV